MASVFLRGIQAPDEIELMIEELLDAPMTVVESSKLARYRESMTRLAVRYRILQEQVQVVPICGAGRLLSTAPMVRPRRALGQYS